MVEFSGVFFLIFAFLFVCLFYVSENILSQEEISDPDKFLTGWLIVIPVFICNFRETDNNFDPMLKLASHKIYKKKMGSPSDLQLFKTTM